VQRKLSHSLDSLIGKRFETNLNGTMFPHVITELLISFKRPQGMVVTHFVFRTLRRREKAGRF